MASRKIPEDVAYTITTGYYPEIASRVKYKHKPGKGPKGRKFIRKRGFTETAIQAERARKDISAIRKGKASILEGMGIAEATDKNDQLYYKYTGGSSQYRLYGDQVWYMHGVREDKPLEEYMRNTFGAQHPRFSQIYSNQESQFSKEAIEMANEIFDRAVDEVEKELEGAEGTDVAEEIGFKEGDFEYMSHKAALNKYPHLAPQLQKQQRSRANERDLVIIKNGAIVGTQDVTEMPIDKIGQHGIVKVPPSLSKAIRDVKEGGGNLEKLRQGVIRMFTNAITNHYNPLIREMKKIANIGGGSGRGNMGDKTYTDILGAIARESVKGSKDSAPNTVTTVTMGNVLGIEAADVGYHNMHKKTSERTSLEYVAHMLGTMNLDTNETFKQSHRVLDYPNGQSVYANVPMVTNPDTLLFRTDVVQNTEILTGYNATLASAEKAGHIIGTNSKEMSKTQKHAFSMTKVTGVMSSKTGQATATANMGILKGARPATVVTIPAVDRLEELLIKDIENASNIPNLGKRLGNKGSELQKRMYGLGKNRKRMVKTREAKKANFWALPYIGVLGSEK